MFTAKKEYLGPEVRAEMAESLFRDEINRYGPSIDEKGQLLLRLVVEIFRANQEFKNEKTAEKAIELLSLIPIKRSIDRRAVYYDDSIKGLVEVLWDQIFSGWGSAKIGSGRFAELGKTILSFNDHWSHQYEKRLEHIAREHFKEASLERLATFCALAADMNKVNETILRSAGRGFGHNSVDQDSPALPLVMSLVAPAMSGDHCTKVILPPCVKYIEECAQLARSCWDLRFLNYKPLDMWHGDLTIVDRDHAVVTFKATTPFGDVAKHSTEVDLWFEGLNGEIAKYREKQGVPEGAKIEFVCLVTPRQAEGPSEKFTRIF